MSDNTKNLLAGFETYAAPEEIANSNATDTPATTVPCAVSAGILTAELGC